MSTAAADYPERSGAFQRRPARSVQELIAEKRARPIESAEDFLEPDVFSSDEEVDEFNEAVREWRSASLA